MPFNKAASSLLALPRALKRLLALGVDASLCVLTVWLAFYLRLGEWLRLSGDGIMLPAAAVYGALLLALPIFVAAGLYRAI
ncbi:MAG: hypothetical protein Q8L56_02720, partial [Rhodocyclaceae bacterium]|nr:hypothetical protein [Rhodocyclaceae bacterium]